MKKLLLASVLTLLFTLPMTALPTTASATWLQVNNPGYWVDIYSEPGYRQGRLRCRIAHGQFVEVAARPGRPHIKKVNGKTYYHVYWKKKFGVAEWHWRDGMNNGWCPHWNRHGWAEADLLKRVNKPGGWWIN